MLIWGYAECSGADASLSRATLIAKISKVQKTVNAVIVQIGNKYP